MKKILLYSLLLLAACDIIEEDLSNDHVVVLAPADGAVTTKQAQTFWWEHIDEALRYKIQIVKPDFNNITELIADTSITQNKITQTLQPGTYQWRIRAENGSTETPWVLRDLVIDTTSDLSGQEIVLVSPLNNTTVSDSTVNFQWQELASATQYRVQIVSKGFGHPSAVTIFDGVVSGSPHTEILPGFKEDYHWRVRGENLSTNTPFSNSWIVEVDTASGP